MATIVIMLTMNRITSDPIIFLIDFSGNFLLLCGLCAPNYLMFRRAAKGLIGAAVWFWLCVTAGIALKEFTGEDMDMALAGNVFFGLPLGLIYCLPALIVVSIWRVLRPNVGGYCRKCGRAVRADQNQCPAGHIIADSRRGFEVIC